jgi:predicted O-methyltransferase YrrM
LRRSDLPLFELAPYAASMSKAKQGAATWMAVDAYLADHLIAKDEVLEAALADSEAAGLPLIQVTPLQGRMLQIFARMAGARRILELGTLGGYSTIWLARALPPTGQVITLEYDAKHAEVARKNFARAGLEKRIELRVGKALDMLPEIAAAHRTPFDLIFIDADKRNNPAYFTWALKLARPGTIIIVDNVVRDGAVLDAASSDADIQGIRELFTMLGKEPRVSATALQTVDAKGHDGFALALVL